MPLSPDPQHVDAVVPGDVATFVASAAHVREAARAADAAGIELRLLRGGLDGLTAQVVTALGARTEGLTHALADAQGTFVDVADRLVRHADELDDLQRVAVAARDRVCDEQRRLRDAEVRRDSAERSAARAAHQVAAARARAALDDAWAELAAAEHAHRAHQEALAWWQEEVRRRAEETAHAERVLAAVGDDAAALVDATGAALRAAAFGRHLSVAEADGLLARLWADRVGALATLVRAAAADGAVLTAQFDQLATALMTRLTPLSSLVLRPLLDAATDEFERMPRAGQFDAVAAVAALYRALSVGADRPGDSGGTYDRERLGPWVPTLPRFGVPTATDRGAGVVLEGLRLTASPHLIGPDEFGVVRIEEDRYVVVLPGVTDLSRPDLGLHSEHRTVRDLDAHALPSSRSTSMAGNRYARMVADGLAAAGVPIGADVMLIGHSFGADTALDLAADPTFNGSGGFNVTHAVAAAYYSDPQLAHVPAHTEVLVLQNAADEIVNLERLADRPADAAVDLLDAVADTTRRDWPGTVGSLAGVGRNLVEFGADVVTRVGGIPPLAPTAGRDLAPLGLGGVVGVTRPRPNQVHAVFDGGGRGWGHHQTNYLEYVRESDAPEVAEFHASVAAAGYAGVGELLAVDVSVPEGPDDLERIR